MDSEHIIRLSGPFSVTDSLGRTWAISGIRIFDEGYGVVDVYVDFETSMEDEPLYEDPQVLRQILARLRAVGYVGPDFGHADLGLQEDKLIVLEASQEFNSFAAARGWRNLAEEYADDDADEASSPVDIIADPASGTVFADLMRRLNVK